LVARHDGVDGELRAIERWGVASRERLQGRHRARAKTTASGRAVRQWRRLWFKFFSRFF
jgi:hypothetical protein